MAIDALAAAERPHPWTHTGPAMFALEAARQRMGLDPSVRANFSSAEQRERDLRQRPDLSEAELAELDALIAALRDADWADLEACAAWKEHQDRPIWTYAALVRPRLHRPQPRRTGHRGGATRRPAGRRRNKSPARGSPDDEPEPARRRRLAAQPRRPA